MSIKRNTPRGAEARFYEQRARKLMIKLLAYVGERVIIEARSHHKYKRRTGNLTSSIGYAVTDNGKVVIKPTFDAVDGGTKGTREGEAYLRKLISKKQNGIVLTVVAGMNYAQYVEAKGLNVLESAEMLAEKLIAKMCKKIKL